MAELNAQVTFRVKDATYDRLQEVAAKERRKMNEIARALLERGIAAYNRDGELFEPEKAERSKVSVPLDKADLDPSLRGKRQGKR